MKLSKHVALGSIWLSIYLALTLAPLALVFVSASQTLAPRPFWTEFSVALGFVGLSTMCLQFALTARFQSLKAPYGSDIIYAFHREIAIFSAVLILAHPAILFITNFGPMLNRPWTHPWPFFLGLASVVCLLWLIGVSIFRQRLKINYDAWRRTHAILGVAAVALAVAHIWMVGRYLETPLQRGLWLAYTAAFVALIIYVRLIKPYLESRSPFRVVSVLPEAGQCWRLTLEPVNHPGFTFAPGQFAWITLFDSPFTDREHPFSLSGSALEPAGRIEFTIKELGDFTARIKHAKPGDLAYVDGPFGALSADRHPEADAYVFIAGGIGITPMISHLRTFAARHARGERIKPCWLFYGVVNPDAATYRDELNALAATLPMLKLVYVFGKAGPAPQPPTGDRVAVEAGYVNRDILAKHGPKVTGEGALDAEWFICGPPVMMDAVESALGQLGVPVGSYHAERFNLA